MAKFGYRSYLDGLRGLASLGVILFHSGTYQLAPGYLGVFFILSGYLITRVRRILPAATVCIFLVSIAMNFVLVPSQINDHGKCTLSTLSYWSNFCFIVEKSDYWAMTKTRHPLEHLWSLSVEQQYYIFYPIVLFLAMAIVNYFSKGKSYSIISLKENIKTFKRYLFVFLLITSISGGCYTLFLFVMGFNPVQAHMGSLERVYQLSFGGLISVYISNIQPGFLKREHRFYGRIASGISCYLLFYMCTYSYFVENFFQLKVFHAIWFFLSIILIGFCLYFLEMEKKCLEGKSNNNGEAGVEFCRLRKILEWKVLVYFGKWSYSIYLWHFPIIILGDHLEIFPFENTGLQNLVLRFILVFGASVAAGVISYYCVEKLVSKLLGAKQEEEEDKKGTKGKVLASLGVLIPLVSVGICWMLVFPKVDQVFSANSIDLNDFEMDISLSNTADHSVITGEISGENKQKGVHLSEEEMRFIQQEAVDIDDIVVRVERVVVFGDSHAENAMTKWYFLSDQFGFELIDPMERNWLGSKNFNSLPLAILDDWDSFGRAGDFGKETIDRWRSILQTLPGYLCSTSPDLIVFYGLAPHLIVDFDENDPETFITGAVRGMERFLEEVVWNCVEHAVYVLPAPTHPSLELSTYRNDIKSSKKGFQACLAKLQAGEDVNCDFEESHLKNYPQVVTALNRISENSDGRFTVVDASSIICPDHFCKATYTSTLLSKKVMTYVDHNHVSADYWVLKSFEFLGLLNENGIYFMDQNQSQRTRKREYDVKHSLKRNFERAEKKMKTSKKRRSKMYKNISPKTETGSSI